MNISIKKLKMEVSIEEILIIKRTLENYKMTDIDTDALRCFMIKKIRETIQALPVYKGE